ncbi:hypothetical protein [Natronomonas amylolytica]|uniref:hypothetical protein n=1 Tax=Natronomonas amylolytica TaxID=3108498 RepID=UPI003009566C
MSGLAALALLAESIPLASDDAAIVGEQVLTTDMHHERTDSLQSGNADVGGRKKQAAENHIIEYALEIEFTPPTLNNRRATMFLKKVTSFS